MAPKDSKGYCFVMISLLPRVLPVTAQPMKRGSLKNSHVKLPLLMISEGWEGSHERDEVKNSKRWMM